MERIAVFGGIYSNYLALDALLADARRRDIDSLYCLGDLGAFGPNPDKIYPRLTTNNINVVQGNYDHSIGNDLNDCQCGYTDPRDNYYAQISYDYTHKNTSPEFKTYQRNLPQSIRLQFAGRRLLLCHGSPRMVNEFLWESTTPDHFLNKMLTDYNADMILVTHTGLHWQRELPSGGSFINVGVIGRPENDGSTNVWYTILTAGEKIAVEFVALEYDYQTLAQEMQRELLPEEFVETILTGWWTTCLEILPARERANGRF